MESDMSDFEDGYDDNELSREDSDSVVNYTTDVKVEGKAKVHGLKHLLDLKQSLGLDEFQVKKSNRKERKRRQKERQKLKKLAQKGIVDSVVQTLATKVAAKKGKVVPIPEVVVFEDARKKSLKRTDGSKQADVMIPEVLQTDEISMKQARFDVFKFSINGMDKANQLEARAALAIKLGAKPAKNQCVPYAEFKLHQKAAKEIAQNRKELERVTGVRVPSARPGSLTKKQSKKSKQPAKEERPAKKKPTKAAKNKGGSMKMGKFDGGMLKLSSKDIAKLKSK